MLHVFLPGAAGTWLSGPEWRVVLQAVSNFEPSGGEGQTQSYGVVMLGGMQACDWALSVFKLEVQAWHQQFFLKPGGGKVPPSPHPPRVPPPGSSDPFGAGVNFGVENFFGASR